MRNKIIRDIEKSMLDDFHCDEDLIVSERSGIEDGANSLLLSLDFGVEYGDETYRSMVKSAADFVLNY